MTEELTEAIRLVMQWLFAPLLAIVALAWLYVRLEASGAFDAICSAELSDKLHRLISQMVKPTLTGVSGIERTHHREIVL